MGRPAKGTDVEAEKALTRAIFREIELASGLTRGELESVFEIGTEITPDKKSGGRIAKYLTTDPKKSRAANRTTLQAVAQKAIEKGWLSRAQIDQPALWIGMGNEGRAYKVFAQRQKERDDLVKSLRNLRKAAADCASVLAGLKHTVVHERIENASQSIQDAWLAHNSLNAPDDWPGYDDELDFIPFPSSSNKSLGPTDVSSCLSWLLDVLSVSHVSFFMGGKEAVPRPRPIASAPVDDAPFDDDDLNALFDKLLAASPTKTGAKVVQ